MKLVLGCRKSEIFFKENCVLTLGSFDGFHRGHRKLLQKVQDQARAKKVSAAVLTFNPHPLQVLCPEKKFLRLFDMDDQILQMKEMGIDVFVIEDFDSDFASLSAEDFLEKYIFSHFKPIELVVGYDFSFGAQKKGDIHFLRDQAQARGIEFEVVSALKEDGEIISSSAIRKALTEGNAKKANQFLGRSYYLKGVVQEGDQRGRQLGFPTANISISSEVKPRTGVYAVTCFVEGKKYPAIANLGRRPTFYGKEDSSYFLETHIFDFSQNIYGQEIYVFLEEFLRDEKKFQGVDELKEQVKKDCLMARKALLP